VQLGAAAEQLCAALKAEDVREAELHTPYKSSQIPSEASRACAVATADGQMVGCQGCT